MCQMFIIANNFIFKFMKTLLNRIAALMTAVVFSSNCFAQIGYQVALLNSATGEPRANETVSCDIRIDNKNDEVIYKGTQIATTNDLGILSLTVGNADMFQNVDWSKLPFFVSVSVDGQLVGRTQILNVPVAEYAKNTGTLTYENISSIPVQTISSFDDGVDGNTRSIQFFPDGTCAYIYNPHRWSEDRHAGTYYIDGNTIGGHYEYPEDNSTRSFIGHYFPDKNIIVVSISN